MKTPDCIVIGGGPAGMMAAGRAAERGRRVVLLERGPAPGRKLLITGSGRCNVTNSAPVAEFLRAFDRAQAAFLRAAVGRFSNRDMLGWLHARGVETVEERRGRVFPASQDAHSVLAALTDYLAAGGGVEVRTGRRVEALRLEGGRVAGVICDGEALAAANVIVATGGLSYPATGSDGDGYRLAAAAGHAIVPPFAAIVGLETVDDWPRRLQGTPIKNAAFVARRGGGKLTESFGEALWTHYGLGGPAVYELSRAVVLALRNGAVTLEVDLRPTDSDEALDRRLLEAVKRSGKRQLKSVLGEWVAERTAAALLEHAAIDARKKMSQCSKADRRRIVAALKHLSLAVAGPRPVGEAIVTGGGVALDEVDPARMESRLVAGLFFAGEVLDIDGPSGGYNLQAAFSTGYLAGESVG